jgi:hypothetical protein
MYFNVYTWNGIQQGQYLLGDLKLVQQVKLSPKATSTPQMMGCIFGAIVNYIMIESKNLPKDPIILLGLIFVAKYRGEPASNFDPNRGYLCLVRYECLKSKYRGHNLGYSAKGVLV